MAKAVGLDIGSRACKVVVIEGGSKGGKVLRYVEREYEFEDSEVLTPGVVLDALKKALQEAKAPKNVVSLALPAEQCILREIGVPFTQDDQIKKVVKFEFEPHLHNAAIEDVVVDYLQTGPGRQGTRLLIFACSKDVLTSRLQRLREVGVDPLHVDVDVAALFNVAMASGVIDEHPTCLIIDIGARTTKTLYVQVGALKVARSMRLGSATVRKQLEADLHGDAEAATRALESSADADALAVAPQGVASTFEIVRSVTEIEAEVAKSRRDEFMTRVLRETQRTLPALGDMTRPTRVFVTGGGAKHAHARERLAEHYKCEVEDLPVLRAVETKLEPREADQLQLSGAVAVGTGLKVLGMDATGIDFRRDEFRYARTFDRIKTALATGVTLLFFAIFLLFLTQYVGLQRQEAEFARLRAAMEDELKVDVFERYENAVANPIGGKINPDVDKYASSVRKRLRSIRGHLKNELGLATEVPPILSGMKVWAAVMASISEVRGKVEYLAIKSENYDQKKGTITVVVGDYPDVDVIKEALRKHVDLFADVQDQTSKRTKDGKIEVPIELEIIPPALAGETSSAPEPFREIRTAEGGGR